MSHDPSGHPASQAVSLGAWILIDRDRANLYSRTRCIYFFCSALTYAVMALTSF